MIQQGVVWGAISFVAIILTMCAVKFLLPVELRGLHAGREVFNFGLAMQIFMCVVSGPILETIMVQLPLVEILRRFSVRPIACIGIGSAIWGLGHYLNGGIAHGVSALTGGAMFTFVYLRYRAGGVGPAFWMTVCAHASNNALALTVSAVLPNF